jgi:hypothetical protein
MSKLSINDSVWHPCNMDIIEHKVISIRQFEDFNQYVLKAKNNVGACGKIEVIVSENNGKLRFVELIDEENIEYASGLGDFIEGNYYTTLDEARLEYYEQQRILCWSNMEQKKRLYEEAKNRYDQVELLVKELKHIIKTKS